MRTDTKLASLVTRPSAARLCVFLCSQSHARAQETLKVGFGEGRKLPNNFARLVLDEESSARKPLR